jgi:tRNA(Ile)-lysidine synthetase-like protein
MILDHVIATIRRHGMLEPRDRVVVAVSGGHDSVALLHALLELRSSLYLTLTVAHLDHGLRGAASDADRAYVEAMAERLGLPCVARREEVASLARRERRSPEEAGRIARRRFLRETAEATGSRRVALGHQREDQAETVLWRLITGSGRGGLSGIRPVSEGLFIRPLLECSRADILAYLESRDIVPREDASNTDRRYPRNRIRHDLLPLLRDAFNPRVTDAIARTAEILREEDDHLDRRARRALAALLIGDENGAPAVASPGAGTGTGGLASAPPLLLDAEHLRHLPLPLARRVLRLALRRAGLAGRDLARERIEEVLDLATRGENRSLSLGESFTARLEYGQLRFEKGAPHPPPGPAAARTLGLPGEAKVAEAGVVIRASLAARESVESDYLRAPAHRIYVDARTLGAPLIVRAPRPGDRLHPLGAPGSRKLSDLWTDLKVGREARRRGLVVECAGRIVWAVGLRMADPFRITEATKDVAILEIRDLAQTATASAGPVEPAPPREDPPDARETSPAGSEPRVLYTAEEIRTAIERLAALVAAWAGGREILVLGVLQGSFIFLADLVRLLPGPLRIGFLDRKGTPIQPFPPVSGARVLVVEDILDTGESLVRILEGLRGGSPEDLRTCVLFDKPSGRTIAIEADFAGLHVPDRWVVGFGLDDKGRGRHLPYLTWV